MLLDIPHQEVFAGFAGVGFSKEDLKVKFPNYQQCELQQTHSDICVPASFQNQEGDAHFTQDKTKMLLIKTADCMPILVYDKSQSKILAVHSGWRGVANRILIKSLIAQNMHKVESQIQIWVGPHIQAQSFECGLDVAEQILSSVKTKSADMILKETKDKKFLNLANILRQQLLEERISFQSLLISDIDTFSNMNWHSFRREKAKVRQYAYIALK